ncbi:HEAT repeat domain-containing protein, partial [Methanoculleus sp.]|uniref:HEAT repeat domain-containing protein n=1 Tax=Methanoculleus sp. TaxID=90427 RepID=UPI00320C83A4
MPFRLIAADIGRLVSKRDLGGLIAAARSEDKDTRWMAAGGLGELRDLRAVDPLIRALADTDPDVRWKAVEAFGSIGDARATEALIPFLNDPDETMRLQAVWALGKIRDPRATAHIIPLLADPDYDMKIATIWALGAIGGGDAAAALRERLLDRHPGIRSKAAESLEKCGWKPADDREWGAFAFARRDWKEASRYSRALADVLIWALDDGYFDVRMHAARILGKTRSWNAVRHLHRALDDPEECVTYEAAAALAEIGN